MQNAKQVFSSAKNSTVVRFSSSQEWIRNGLRVGLQLLHRTAPDLASLAAERLFRSPRRHARPAWEQEILAGATRFRIPWGAETLPAWSWGKGPTVLLVHGWEGRGSQLGAFVEPLVEMGYRVVTFDSPGHGDAPGRHATVVEIAGAVSAALAELGPVHAIIAHSVGGPATTYALSRTVGHPPRVAFIAPPTSALRFTKAFASTLGLAEDARLRLVARLEERYGIPLTELEATRHAPRMTSQLLVVHDHDDREVPFEAGATLADHWPGSRLVATRGLGHRRILRAPQVIDAVLELVAGAPFSMRTGLARFALERELFERERRRAA